MSGRDRLLELSYVLIKSADIRSTGHECNLKDAGQSLAWQPNMSFADFSVPFPPRRYFRSPTGRRTDTKTLMVFFHYRYAQHKWIGVGDPFTATLQQVSMQKMILLIAWTYQLLFIIST